MNGEGLQVGDINLSASHTVAPGTHPSGLAGWKIEVTGISQGVGFRPFVYRLAREEGLTGSVRNDAAGVTIEVFGWRVALDRFVKRLIAEAPAPARLRTVRTSLLEFEHRPDFEIAASETRTGRCVSIPADMATCPECVAEIFDRGN